MLLAAVHFLLLRDKQLGSPLAELAKYYPSVSREACDYAGVYAAFQKFCRTRTGELRELVATRLVQTNEVGRCSYLYLAFGLVGKLTGGRPLSLVELGTSAGLNLLFDRYGYTYRHPEFGSRHVGKTDSAVQIEAELRGDLLPEIPAQPPAVAFRCGIDLNVVDVNEPDEALWLRAMVWPDQLERAEVLKSAIDVLQEQPPRLVSGDALQQLDGVVRRVPDDSTLCIFHTHTIHTWSNEACEELLARLARIAERRALFHISTEWLDAAGPQLEIARWDADRANRQLLARCDDHGRWIEWSARDADFRT